MTEDTKTRLNLAFSPAVHMRIQRVRAMSECSSVSELIRRAIAVYDELITTVVEEGGEVILRDKNGVDTILKIIW